MSLLDSTSHPSSDATSREARVDKQSLRDAIRGGQICVVFQPIVLLRTGKIVGAEALVRWNHPSLGLLRPGRFIDVAEATGLVTPLFFKVLELGLETFAGGHPELAEHSLSINLSPVSLIDIHLPDRIVQCLDSYGFEPGRLVVEITETGAMGDASRYMDVLNRLRIKGVHLSVDDFGTGSSSLVHLDRLPFSQIKIDRSFVSELDQREDAATIVRSIIGLASGMNLSVVAEGIEDQATYDWLLDLECDRGQGFLISPPVEAESLLQLVRNRARATPSEHLSRASST